MLDPQVVVRANAYGPDAAPPSALPAPAAPAAAAGAKPGSTTGLNLTARAMAAALDEIGQGLVIVDVPSGRLRHANRQALTECTCHGTLDLHDGHVQAPAPADQRALQQALGATLQGRRSLVTLRGPGAMPAEDLDDDAPPAPPLRPGSGALVVAVVPLPTEGTWPQALIVFGRRQAADTLAAGYFARLHGLTPTEESVLRALCSGRKPTDIAKDQGVAISTIRTHVNAIRVKTGAGSIREIAQQVATLPPIAPALRDGVGAPPDAP